MQSPPSPAAVIDLPDGAHRVTLRDGRAAFVKIGRRKPCGFFAAEARGLEALREARALRVPSVYWVDDHGIAIEDLGAGRARAADWERAGRGLARLHQRTGEQFGSGLDGWCGDSAQDNTPDPDGFRFFAERRLLPQGRRALDGGRLDRGDLARLESICARLKDLLPQQPPVLVHGDLWSGNLHACANGELGLIDGGAVHHGWAEGDLAMLTLFGMPPEEFFGAYAVEAEIDSSWRGRAPLLNLYHLLNHLNLFGRGYYAAVADVRSRYA